MSYISKVNLNGTEYDIKDAESRKDIDTIQEAITSAPYYYAGSSINSVAGTFYFDNKSGIDTSDLPSLYDSWGSVDFVGFQIGSANGAERVQYVINNNTCYKRATDAALGSEDWSADTWTYSMFEAASKTVGSGVIPMYLSSGTLTASSSTVGDSSTPVYLNAGTITKTSNIPYYYTGDSIQSVAGTFYFDSNSGIDTSEIPSEITETSNDWTGFQFGMANGRDRTQFIFDNKKMYRRSDDNAVGSEEWDSSSWQYCGFRADSNTTGSDTNPVYVNAGVVTASSSTVGDSSTPVYLNAGTITKCSNVVSTSDFYYESGDTFTGTAQPLYGYISSSCTTLYLSLNMPKSMSNVTPSVTALTAEARGVSGYLNSESGYIDWLSNADSINVVKRNAMTLGLNITMADAITNTTNNTPVSLRANITVAFT